MANNKIDLLKKYNSLKRPLVLDGAMGSLIQQKNYPADKYLWYSKLNIAEPGLIKNIHKEYISAGADIITTNTFRTNPEAVKLSGLDIDLKEFIYKSVQLAIESRSDSDIIIAASNAPAEDCYQIERRINKFDLEYNHKKHIELLWESGADIIWNETQSHWDELEIIAKFCSGNSLPFAMNLYFTDELKLLTGEPLNEAVDFIKSYNPEVIGFNCVKHESFGKYFGRNNFNYKWGFYFNCGAGNVTDEIISCGINPEDYLNIIKMYLNGNTVFIGSCCGSSQLHTSKIKEYLNEVYRD